jgi:prepilin-type N-terminal cleavage/methylation domain-containing protein
MHPRRAFSLIELVIVLVIVGVASAIALPRYGQSLSRSRVEALAQRISADMQSAGDTARAQSASYHVQFAPASNRYRLAAGPAGAGGSIPGQRIVNVAQDPYACEILNADFASATGVTFDGYGRPSAIGHVTIGCGRHYRRVSIDANGHVSITTQAEGPGTAKSTPPDPVAN